MPSSWLLNRNFALLWFGQSISQLGDAIIEVTLPIWVGILTHNPTSVALIATTEVLPPLCFGPLAGACVDRWNPRTTMIFCDLLRCICIVSLLLVPPTLISWYLYVVSFVIALVGSFFHPAKSVAMRLMIEEGEIARAQTLSRATQSLTLILGPLLGAILLFLYGPGVGLTLDACSFDIGAAALLFTRLSHPLIRQVGPSAGFAWKALLLEIGEGLRLVLRDRMLVLLAIVSSVTMLVGQLWFSIDVFFVQSSLKQPATSVGLLWMVSGTGGLTGSLLILLLGKRSRQKSILLAGLLLRGISLTWYATMTSYAWALPAAFCAGLGDDFIIMALGSLVMEHTNPEMLGKITALLDAASALSTGLALVTVAFLTTWLHPWQLLLLCGIALCMVGVGTTLALRDSRSS